ncbi:monoamine oxidase [Rhodococcus sp. SORGH_AS303]|nr:monoamine oxidase [Rhodococcus sp. SORGH_AS_0303]
MIAVPLPRAADIDGALPAGAGERMRNSRMGEYAKTIVVYDEPWWREDGLTGTVLDVDGPVQMVVDGDPGADSPGVLVAFSGGRAASDLFSRSDRREVVVAELVRLFGAHAASPRRIDDITWSEQPWLGGAPTAIPPYGGVFEPSELTTGRVHWAGTDLADRWPGYLDGAVRSGRRAAAEIIRPVR